MYQRVPKSTEAGTKLAANWNSVFNAWRRRSIETLEQALQKQLPKAMRPPWSTPSQRRCLVAERVTAFLEHTERRGAYHRRRASDLRYERAEHRHRHAGAGRRSALGCWRFIGRQVLQPLKDAAVHFDRIASGDLDRVTVNSTMIGVLFTAPGMRCRKALTRTVAEVRRSVSLETTTGAAAEIAWATPTCRRTGEQAASLEQTAASMEELATAVKRTPNTRTRPTPWLRRRVALRGEAVGQVATMDRIRKARAASRKSSL